MKSTMTTTLWIVAVATVIVATTTVNAAGLKCDSVRPIFEAQGFPLSDIPKEAISWVERTSPMESERSGEMNKIPKDILALKIDDAAAVNYVSLCSLMYDFLSTYLRFFRDNGA
ncbi:hypothetical protein ALC57_18605 [Trachymyrmex cornetzi]|uniref:Uncharacterized protein n=1 Tax=Trachymyrmex cornetzi TaxID=471704 RepID=A0A151IRF4_9HYME|nr:hypothetical protein ALC57_18605 [Trachymyrmex cornetzi]